MECCLNISSISKQSTWQMDAAELVFISCARCHTDRVVERAHYSIAGNPNQTTREPQRWSSVTMVICHNGQPPNITKPDRNATDTPGVVLFRGWAGSQSLWGWKFDQWRSGLLQCALNHFRSRRIRFRPNVNIPFRLIWLVSFDMDPPCTW